MAKKLRTKLANIALCGTMIIQVAGQAVPVLAQSDLIPTNSEVISEETEADAGEEASGEVETDVEETTEQTNADAKEEASEEVETDVEETTEQTDVDAKEEVTEEESDLEKDALDTDGAESLIEKENGQVNNEMAADRVDSVTSASIEIPEETEEEENGSIQIADGEYIVSINAVGASTGAAVHQLKSDELNLKVEDGKVYLETLVEKGSNYDVTSLEQKVSGEYVPLDTEEVTIDGVVYLRGWAELESIDQKAYVRFSIQVGEWAHAPEAIVQLTEESIARLTAISELEMQVISEDVTSHGLGSITVSAVGGSGSYEYTIDGGHTWENNNVFLGLTAGTYEVGVRDANDQGLTSEYQVITIAAYIASTSTGIKDGNYSIDIKVLQENSDSESMASQFFNKKDLPLEIRNGKAYLTIQVAKDGELGGILFKDVITSIKQKINGKYQSLALENLDDSSTHYITATVVFDSLDEEAYLSCAIAPMGGAPILRIRLDQSSMTEGMGSLQQGLGTIATVVESVTAENGKVTITLSQTDDTIKASDFTGKLYINGSSTGKALTLNQFSMIDRTVTFTYDELAASQEDQKAVVAIIYNDVEMRSEAFTVLAEGSEQQTAAPITSIALKENAKEVNYINGYTDGTFKPNQQVTKAEALKMLSLLVDIPQRTFLTANMEVLQSDKDEVSMAKQFFKTEGVNIEKTADGYVIYLEITNEGLGFSNIITGISQKIDGAYTALEVTKSQDLKTAYVSIKVADLKEEIMLQTGIAPMGSVSPELRLVFDGTSVKESSFQSQYTDIEGWAKEIITLFESAGVIGEDNLALFYPNKAITRGELIKIIALTTGLEINNSQEAGFSDIKGHEYEAYITAAAEAGLIVGYGDGTFRADKTLSRAEAVAIINRVVGHDGSTHVSMDNPFSDLKASHWAYNEILKVTNTAE